MRTTRPITVSLPTDLLREALQQYLASARWQRLRRWGAETAERLGIRTEEDLQRLLDKVATGRRRGGA